MKPVGPYSPWRRAGDLVVISGQLGLLPGHDAPTMVEGGAPEQLRQALANARLVLSEAGAKRCYGVAGDTLNYFTDSIRRSDIRWVHVRHEEAGATFDQVVKATLFLVDMDDFASCNDVWVEGFEAPRPTRSAVAVAQLPLGARCEVELWAFSPQVAG